MPRRGGKRRIRVSIEDEILSWAEGISGPGLKFRDIHHAVEFALYRLREQLEEE